MNDMYQSYCSHCDRDVLTRKETKREHLKVRDAWVDVDQVAVTCPLCGERIGDEVLEEANFRHAYEAYRTSQDLLSAAEIRSIYESHGLSQASFAKLLGLGAATLSRYENGSVQTRQIDKSIRASAEPNAMLDLLVDKGSEIPATQRRRAEQYARKELSRKHASRSEYAVERGDFSIVINAAELSRLNGFRTFDLARAREMTVFFASECRHFYKLRFFKALFYADFTAFAENSQSMSGLRYAHAPNGPIVHEHALLFALLIDGEALDLETCEIGEGVAEKIVALRNVNLDLFTKREQVILRKTAAFINSYQTSSALSEYTHGELGWRETKNGQIISYEYALDLNTAECINGEV